MKCAIVITFAALLVLSQSASLNSRESFGDLAVRAHENELEVEAAEMSMEEEMEARVYKGYNGGNRVWYG